LIWCFAFAGAGWALGNGWQSLHRGYQYFEYGAIALTVLIIAVAVVRRRLAKTKLTTG
jgi:membrane protein DedA with SNARE-associated domain